MTLQKQLKSLAAILPLFVCQGCAEIKTLGNNDIAAYAEAVFRRQNVITSRIMMSTNEALLDDQRLHQAEMAMYDACKLLNVYSSREMDGEPMDVLFKRKVKASIKGCDDSIKRVEKILLKY